MPDLKTIVATRLEELGLKPIPAAQAVGLERGFINDILIGRKKSISSARLPLVAKALQLDPDTLAAGVANPLPAELKMAGVAMPARDTMPRDVPVMGTAAGSATSRGAFQLSSDVIDYVARPPGLTNARDVYALYVEGDSMEPRFEPGDLVFISPHKPMRINDAIIIQEPNSNNGEPQAFIKILRRRTAEHIVTRQLNPESEVRFVNHPGTRLHKVLTMNELFGI